MPTPLPPFDLYTLRTFAAVVERQLYRAAERVGLTLKKLEDSLIFEETVVHSD